MIDVICIAPYSLDFPLWRESMERHRDKFSKIINVLYVDHRADDYSDFIIENTPWATTIDAGEVTGDWRNYTTNQAIEASTADRILFLEQDFIASDYFWQLVLSTDNARDIVGFKDIANQGHQSFNGLDGVSIPEWDGGERFHPAFLMVSRHLLDKTDLDFAAHTELGKDHFGTLSNQLLSHSTSGLNLYYLPEWKHYASVTYNFMLVAEGKPPVGNNFREFVEMSMAAKVKQDPRFMRLCHEALSMV